MQKEVFTEDSAVLKNIKLPLLEVVHDLEDVGPLARTHFNNLPQPFLVFFDLILIDITIISVQLFQKVI